MLLLAVQWKIANLQWAERSVIQLMFWMLEFCWMASYFQVQLPFWCWLITSDLKSSVTVKLSPLFLPLFLHIRTREIISRIISHNSRVCRAWLTCSVHEMKIKDEKQEHFVKIWLNNFLTDSFPNSVAFLRGRQWDTSTPQSLKRRQEEMLRQRRLLTTMRSTSRREDCWPLRLICNCPIVLWQKQYAVRNCAIVNNCCKKGV